jgi:hypothetical protein
MRPAIVASATPVEPGLDETGYVASATSVEPGLDETGYVASATKREALIES